MLSTPIYIISHFNIFSQIRSSLLLPAYGWVGQGQRFLAAHFAKRNTKFGGGKARAGKNSFPPTLFLFARPSDWISEFKIGIFVKKSSDFNQKAPIKNFTLTCAEFFIGPGRIRTVRSERSERRQKR